jgi:hypothetical protein
VRALLALAVVCLGCGYRFTAGGAPLPEGIRSVEVPVFGNKTAEPGLEAAFTQAMRLQLARAGLDSPANAEAQILGEILAVSAAPTLVTPAGALASYRLSISARLKLVKSGRTLSDVRINGAEDYLPGVDVVEAEANRAAAMQRLAQTLMRDGYDQLSTGW